MRLIYFFLLLTFLAACSKEQNVSIHFNDEVFLDAQINFVRQLENLDSLSVTSIKTILEVPISRDTRTSVSFFELLFGIVKGNSIQIS